MDLSSVDYRVEFAEECKKSDLWDKKKKKSQQFFYSMAETTSHEKNKNKITIIIIKLN